MSRRRKGPCLSQALLPQQSLLFPRARCPFPNMSGQTHVLLSLTEYVPVPE